jgi:rootletin
MRQALSRVEAEKRSLQEELGRSESRATKLEVQRLSLEGDLQRLQMILQEKDSYIQVCSIAHIIKSVSYIRIYVKFII